MSESTSIPDPATLPDGAGAVQSEGAASLTSIDNGQNGVNGQDISMGGQEDSGIKNVKPGDNAAKKKGDKDANAPSSTTRSYRSASNPGLVTLKVPSDRLAQLSLNSSATPAASSANAASTPSTTTTNMVGRSFVPDAATGGNSRAASADRTGDRVAMPTEAATHGAPTRQYLNSKVTYHVMEGMKIVAKERPAEPLRVLGEFLLKRSKEIEGTANGAGEEAKEADKNGDEQ